MSRKKKQEINNIDEIITPKQEIISNFDKIEEITPINISVISFKSGYYKLGIYWLEMNKKREFKVEEFEKYKNSQVENDIKKGILKIEFR